MLLREGSRRHELGIRGHEVAWENRHRRDPFDKEPADKTALYDREPEVHLRRRPEDDPLKEPSPSLAARSTLSRWLPKMTTRR